MFTMNATMTIAATLVGAAIGAVCATVIHAQQTKAPLGYVIAEIDVTDPATYQKYSSQVPATLEPYGGHYLVRGGKTQALEGDAPHRVVVIAFESAEKAKAWEDSPAYSAIRPIRQSSAKSRVFIVEGVTP